MIECIFTIDYEIYGNGEGSLAELVYEPAERLMAIFRKRNARFVAFVEIAELEMIEAKGTDQAIDLVKRQIRDFHREGFELGLHLHPQWCNARFRNGRWLLDYSEYNLCTLPRDRIVQIVDRSLSYLGYVLDASNFTPLSFRAGNWLLQPTETVAAVLAGKGIKIDSSVFKGGVQGNYRLDYRPALKNRYYWRFQSDVNLPDPNGALLEIPIFTKMVPWWNMLTAKRVDLQRKSLVSSLSSRERLKRLWDYFRLWYPLKFDFCRMTVNELSSMTDRVIREDLKNPSSYKPMVAIGHTKDLVDFGSVEYLLSYLKERSINVSTFDGVYAKCQDWV
jgi:hypothetical protein